MDALTLENGKGVLLTEPLSKTIQISIFDVDMGTSHLYNLTPAEAIKLSHYLFKASVAVNTQLPSSKLVTG